MKKFLTILLLFSLVSCSGGETAEIPVSYESVDENQSTVVSSSFKFEDEFASPESSWIEGASYASEDGDIGYLTMYTKRGDTYVHQDVPLSIWQGFKSTSSKGSFYNDNLRNQYQLEINE